MPPQMRHQETPLDQRDARIQKYLNLAREYWRMAPAYLAEDDFRQACEKGWGTVTQLTKAVATLRGWEHYDHDDIRDAVRDLGREMTSEAQAVTVIRSLGAAESLYGKFYEVSMNTRMARLALDDVRPLLEILWQQLPAEYTAGLSFAAFCPLEPEPDPEPPQPARAGAAPARGTTIMPTPNFANRTLYHGDNLAFLRGMNSGTVQLIATDPPFNKNRDFHATPDSLAAGAGFQDRWRWEQDVHPDWLDQIKDDWPAVDAVVETAKLAYGPDMAAFLAFMAVRLLEMRRVLCHNGSIYLHCDPTAAAYLKALMDAIFGHQQFRNEIVWQRTESHHMANRYGNVADVILFYTKSGKAVWNRHFHEYDGQKYSEQQLKRFRHIDDDGRRYRLENLTAPRIDGDSGKFEWRGTTPGPTRGWGYALEQLEQWWAEGRIHTRRDGAPRTDGLKVYLDESAGKPLQNIWTDIPRISNTSSERAYWPTQKPLALYERIISVSSNPGDIVLDPFAGCATTCVAAERLGRQWVGIDIWDQAHAMVLDRLHQEGLAAPRADAAQPHLLTFGDVYYSTAPPVRTDDAEPPTPQPAG